MGVVVLIVATVGLDVPPDSLFVLERPLASVFKLLDAVLGVDIAAAAVVEVVVALNLGPLGGPGRPRSRTVVGSARPDEPVLGILRCSSVVVGVLPERVGGRRPPQRRRAAPPDVVIVGIVVVVDLVVGLPGPLPVVLAVLHEEDSGQNAAHEHSSNDYAGDGSGVHASSSSSVSVAPAFLVSHANIGSSADPIGDDGRGSDNIRHGGSCCPEQSQEPSRVDGVLHGREESGFDSGGVATDQGQCDCGRDGLTRGRGGSVGGARCVLDGVNGGYDLVLIRHRRRRRRGLQRPLPRSAVPP
mmetsp:Transcript_54696/g.163461  ORF Transcript_54696/g.163461 Transcript_54696/m.163461 type:complete len:300 (+) Transcript_54696:368-1267(+)